MKSDGSVEINVNPFENLTRTLSDRFGVISVGFIINSSTCHESSL